MRIEVHHALATASAAELRERSRAAAAVLAANAERSEHDLRPAPESLAAVRESGLFALAVPREYGGLGADLRTQVGAITELGQGCPSTAWVTAACAGAKTGFAAMVGAEVHPALFADPDAIVCGSAVASGASGDRVPGGVRFSGRWRTASGCEDATWAVLVVPVARGGGPATPCPTLVPAADLRVERTWRAVGMAGTGSHTLVADGVVVPVSHVVLPTAGDGPPRLNVSPTLLFRPVVTMLAPVLGAALGARRAVETMLAGECAPHGTTYRRMADSPLARHWLTEATHLIDSAVRRALSVADVLDATATPLPVRERADLRMEVVTAVVECRQAVDRLLDLHGASGFDHDNPLQRFWRDLAVTSRNPQLNRYINAEDYGRVLLDAEDPVMPGL